MTRRRSLITTVGQWVFLAAVGVAIVVAWIDQGSAITEVLRRADTLGAAFGLIGAVSAMLALVPHWRAIAAMLGSTVDRDDARAIVVAGQLGKYIPGGVWTIGAQGVRAHQAHLPWRLGVVAGLVQIGTLIVLGLGIGGWLVVTGATPLPAPWGLVGIVIAFVGLLPPTLRATSRFMLRTATEPSGRPVLPVLVASAGYWAGSVVLATGCALALDSRAVVATIAASTVGYIAGAAVIIAPAGVGVREAVVIGMLAPVTDLPTAAAIALLLRLLAVIGDLIGALLLTLLGLRG